MATMKQVVEAVAASIGRAPSSVAAYATALSERGVLPRSKRGRGAPEANAVRAAKLLLAVLLDGKAAILQDFVRYANMAVSDRDIDGPIYVIAREILGLKERAHFLDFIEGLVGAFADGTVVDLIYQGDYPKGFLSAQAYAGPEVDIRLRGPVESGAITFQLSHSALDTLASRGFDESLYLGPQTIEFVPWLYGEARKSVSDVDRAAILDGATAQAEARSRGVRFERIIGGEEVAAAASALASGGLRDDAI